LVTSITSFGRSGLSDFLLQRASAVVLGLYALCVVSWLLLNPQASYEELGWYFGSLPMRLFSTLALFSLLAHAWIGMWTVGTDYIRKLMFGRIYHSLPYPGHRPEYQQREVTQKLMFHGRHRYPMVDLSLVSTQLLLLQME